MGQILFQFVSDTGSDLGMVMILSVIMLVLHSEGKFGYCIADCVFNIFSCDILAIVNDLQGLCLVQMFHTFIFKSSIICYWPVD